MIIPLACLVSVAVIAWLLFVRSSDLPVPVPVDPSAHLIERRAAIYENLRDLQFEYRVGKLSDADYQNTKRDLQKELAGVLAQMDGVKLDGPKVTLAPALPDPVKPEGPPYVCPFCKSRFDVDLKFCGECGQPMKEGAK